MGRPLSLVIFDVDGTLVDSQAQIVGSMTAAFAALDLAPPPREDVLSIVGLSLPVAVARLCPDMDPETCERIVDGYKASFTTMRTAAVSPLYPGAAEVIARLGNLDDVLLGIATGKSRRGLRHVLAAHGLVDRFVTLQVADDHPSKPHPSMVLAALAESGVARENAVIVGDTTYDIEMGRAAGIHALGVAWGYHPVEALTRAGARSVIGDFAGLDGALDDLWGDWR